MYLLHAFTLTKLERSVSKMSQSITRKKTNVMFIKVNSNSMFPNRGKSLSEMISLIKEKITLRNEKGRKSRDSGA